jgi:phage tail protein X
MAMRSRVELGNCTSGVEDANHGLAETTIAPAAH